MKRITNILAAMGILVSLTACHAQIKNAKTVQETIYGNCDMCRKHIETAGNLKKIARVEWDKTSKMATITFDSTQTNQDAILKNIALAGYDSNQFLAPDDAYNKLPSCCQYDRVNKTHEAKTHEMKDHAHHHDKATEEMNHEANHDAQVKEVQKTDQLLPLFDQYYNLKDALVKSNGKQASEVAKVLMQNINAVKMNQLSQSEHDVWMKVLKNLKANTEKILETTQIENQRKAFMALSAGFYDLLKVSKPENPVYYQHCPMYNDGKGAYWLSKENEVKNPYYGSLMMTCGKTVETIK